MSLIKFHVLGDDLNDLEVSSPEIDWPAVRAYFTQLGFKTIVDDAPWEKFVSSFSK